MMCFFQRGAKIVFALNRTFQKLKRIVITFVLALAFVSQSYSIFIAQDKSESEFFFKNVNNSPIYNLSVTNTWNSGSNIEDTNLHQRRSESFENNNNDIVALASFYDRPEYRNRKPSIDVSQHSKKRRLQSIWNYTIGLYDVEKPQTNYDSEKETIHVTSTLKSVTSRIRNIKTNDITIDDISEKKSTVKLQVLGTQNNNKKPKLKVGIILPSKIFKQRDYNRYISRALNTILQEEDCEYNRPHKPRRYSKKYHRRNVDNAYLRSTRHFRSIRRSQFRSRDQSNIFINSRQRSRGPSRKQSLGKSKSKSNSIGKSNQQKKYEPDSSTSSENLLGHIKKSYDFVWNSNVPFPLEDNKDSIIYSVLDESPPPSDITDILCQQVSNGSVAILYFTNTEQFGRRTAASQYFLQMAGFLGIPVIAWNADNAGLESRAYHHLGSEETGHLQLAPSIKHQVSAMLSILERYNLRQFGIVTSEIAGHDDFVQTVRDKVQELSKQTKGGSKRRFVVQNVFTVSEKPTKGSDGREESWNLSELKDSEVRIILLYCTQVEASKIMESARKRKLTDDEYLWVVTQSVVGDPEDSISRSIRESLPTGMLGVHFKTKEDDVLQDFVMLALKVFFHSVDEMLHKSINKVNDLNGKNDILKKTFNRGNITKAMNYEDKEAEKLFNYHLNCQGADTDNHHWKNGLRFYRHLLNIKFKDNNRGRSKREDANFSKLSLNSHQNRWEKDNDSNGLVPSKYGITQDDNDKYRIFNGDGYLRDAELKVMNFKPWGCKSNTIKGKCWEEIGTWNTWNGLDIKDIVWPGESHVPPQGVPEKFHMKITFLEEPPFIILSEPDPISGKCSMNHGVPCWMGSDRHNLKNKTRDNEEKRCHMNYNCKCCSGLCIDLLTKFEDELGFTYELVRTNDPKWGTLEGGKWNGLMRDLVDKNSTTDMVLSALRVNADREAAIDFTIPYLESGIAIVVAKRTGIISPTAFLEPFDGKSWLLIGMVALQVSALSIFLFEWLSPSGFDMQVRQPPNSTHNFSLLRTYWLVFSVLFQAAVKVDSPRGLTARFMNSIWALFAVVFLSLYTANLAAFMIPRKEYFDLSGLDDPKIANPLSQKPTLKFGTIPFSYTQVTLQKHYPSTAAHMKMYTKKYNTTDKAVKAVKDGELDAFIYDGTVLNYLSSQDDECRLLQVGTWSAMTGYALAFPLNSKYKSMFDEKLLELRETGDLERLSRFWMSGMCKPNVREKHASEPLSIAQFLSAFLLLGIGTALSIVFIIMEHLYMKYLQNYVDKKNTEIGGCFSLISQSIGKNYTYAEKYNNVQGMRLATSSEFDSSFGAKENIENIKLQDISKFRRNDAMGQVNICTGQEMEPDKLGNSPFHPSALNSPIHLLSSNAKQYSIDANQPPPAYSIREKDSTESLKSNVKLSRSRNHQNSVLNINPSTLFSSKLTKNSPNHCYVRSCQDDPICNAKFSRLTSELETAKKQVQYLEDILKKKDLEEEENESSTDADFIDLDQDGEMIHERRDIDDDTRN